MRSQIVILLLALLPAFAHGSSLANVEVYDRTAGQVLPIHEYQGRLYVAGEPRHQYELRIHSRTPSRLLAVTSVDGVNVISGATAAENQNGYVLNAHDTVGIEGWRKSLDDVATFYFTSLGDSYAARTGRPNDVGVIGVALFSEVRRCCEYLNEQRAAGAAAAPSAEASADAATDSSARQRREGKLGTGHGHRESSPAQYVDFQRASAAPDETIVIYYDSRRNLVAQGVIPSSRWYAQRRPSPFPDGFARDPGGED